MKNIYLALFIVILPIEQSIAFDNNMKSLQDEFCEYHYMTPLYRAYEGNKHDSMCKYVFRQKDLQNARFMHMTYKNFIQNF